MPIIVLSCSTTSSDGSNNNGGNNNGGTDTGGGDSSTTKVTPKLKSEINLIGSLASIYDNNKTDTNTLLANDIKNNLDKTFDNSSDLANKNFNITVDGGFSSTSTWSGDNYSKNDDGKSSWESTTIDADKTIYYNLKSSQIDISSLNDLKTKLSNDFLKNAFKDVGVTIADGTTLSVSNKLGLIDGDLLHVNIVANTSTKANITNYDLQIPVSDINLSIDSCKITVSGDDVETVNGTVKVDYNIGIQNNTTYTGPTDVKQLTEDAIANSVMTALNFVKTPSLKTSTQSSIFKSSKEVKSDEISTIELDSQKIGETLGIYNTTFSNQKLELVDNPSTQSSDTDTNYLTYKMTITGTPNANYYWEDGSNSGKEFSFNVKVNQKQLLMKIVKLALFQVALRFNEKMLEVIHQAIQVIVNLKKN